MLKLVDISYGGENGFNQAIELSAEVLSNVKFIQEKKLIGKKSNGVCTSWYSVQKKKTRKGQKHTSDIIIHPDTLLHRFFGVFLCISSLCIYTVTLVSALNRPMSTFPREPRSNRF